MPAILFVCTANVCRSPMASALFKQMVQQAGEKLDWRIESAGTWALEGASMASGSELALRAKGIPLEDHQARGVTREMLASFNLILTMERGHKEALKVEFPDLTGRVYLLSEMIGQEFDLRDPMGGTSEDFEETLETIERILNQGFRRICELSTADQHNFDQGS